MGAEHGFAANDDGVIEGVHEPNHEHARGVAGHTAQEGEPASGTFRWIPAPDDPEGLRQPWQLELECSGVHSRGSVDVPASLASMPGSISLWKKLEPDRESTIWAGKAQGQLPTFGLRIRTLPVQSRIRSGRPIAVSRSR